MTELTLSPSLARGGYAAQRKRSPSALAAAIALNGGAFALILLAPATQYLAHHDGALRTRWITIEPLPPENKPDAKPTRPNPFQHTIPKPDPDTPTVVDPVVQTGGGIAIGDVGVGTLVDPTGIGEVKPVERPVHTPLLVKAIQDPRYASAFHPDYPPALVRQGLEGSATVRITIDETGKVIACELVKATDPAFFDETRTQALRHWRFRPATSDGTPIQSQQVLTVQFRLEDR